ncbi:MAG: hypothetical protein R3F46_09420 [bacterium]
MMRLASTSLIAVCMLLLAFGTQRASAFTDLSAEQWAEVEARGELEPTRQWMRDLHAEVNNPRQLSVEDQLALIDSGYGLPTQITSPDQPAGSLRVNYDMNDVIDERDVLGLGLDFTERGTSVTVPHGSPKGLTILLKFSDQAPTDKTFSSSGSIVNDGNHNAAWADNNWYDQTPMVNIEESSVSNYYNAMSNGKLNLDGDVFNDPLVCDTDGWITANVTRASITGSGGVFDVIEDALQQIDPHVDFADYDSNNDGFLDGLTVIYAGSSNSATIFWHFRFIAIYMTADNIVINSGIWTGEEAPLRTWCHEFGHELGLPDLYDTGGSPAVNGVGQYGLMAEWYTGQGASAGDVRLVTLQAALRGSGGRADDDISDRLYPQPCDASRTRGFPAAQLAQRRSRAGIFPCGIP